MHAETRGSMGRQRRGWLRKKMSAMMDRRCRKTATRLCLKHTAKSKSVGDRDCLQKCGSDTTERRNLYKVHKRSETSGYFSVRAIFFHPNEENYPSNSVLLFLVLGIEPRILWQTSALSLSHIISP